MAAAASRALAAIDVRAGPAPRAENGPCGRRPRRQGVHHHHHHQRRRLTLVPIRPRSRGERRSLRTSSSSSSTSSTSSSSSSASASLAETHRDGDLLSLTLADAPPSLSSAPLLRRAWYFEVTSSSRAEANDAEDDDDDDDDAARDRDAVEGVVRGVRCVLARDPATRALSLAPAPPASQPAPLALRKWVRDAFPAWASLLEELRDDGRYGRGDATDFATRVHPNPTGDDAMPCAVTAVEWVTSYDALKAEVLRDPSFWRDGTPPNAPPATPREQATLNAGEARPIRHTGPHTTAFAL